MSRKSHTRATRRDRRKARQSDFAREGTRNPRKKGHHAYEAVSSEPLEDKVVTTRRVVCRDDERLHEFTCFPELGVKVCSCCGERRKMDEDDFQPMGNRLHIPAAVRRRVVKPSSTREESTPPEADATTRQPDSGGAAYAAAQGSGRECRPGEHELKLDAELGIRVCRHCTFFTK